MVAALRKHPEVDVDALRQGQYTPRKIDSPQAQSAIGADDTKLIRRLVTRLHDRDLLEDFGLVHRAGRIKMDGGAGLDLVPPEEMRGLDKAPA